MGTSPSIFGVERGRFDAGFFGRVQNLAYHIDQKLLDLENWQSWGSAYGEDRKIGVKVVGHSLGAATATIVGTYVADRYWDRPNDRDVEILAYSSPRAVGRKMAKAIRNAAASCNFNVHVFNNALDVVTHVPAPASQIYGRTSINFDPPEHCQYVGGYTTRHGAQGEHRPTGIVNYVAQVLTTPMTFVLNRHGLPQWTLGNEEEHLTLVPVETAAYWFPTHAPLGGFLQAPLGGSVQPTARYVRSGATEGTFIASLESFHNKYVVAEGNGGLDVNANRSRIGAWERLRFVPDYYDCVRHGSKLTLSTTDATRHFLRANDGGVDARIMGADQLDEKVSFTLFNHTSRSGCIAEGDQISLRAYDGRYVVAEENGQLNANRTRMINWEKFRVRKIHGTIPMSEYNLDLGGGGEGNIVTLELQHPVHDNGVWHNLGHGEGVPVIGANNSYKHYSLKSGWVLYYYEGSNYTGASHCFDSDNGTVPSSIRYRINSARVYVGAGCPHTN